MLFADEQKKQQDAALRALPYVHDPKLRAHLKLVGAASADAETQSIGSTPLPFLENDAPQQTPSLRARRVGLRLENEPTPRFSSGAGLSLDEQRALEFAKLNAPELAIYNHGHDHDRQWQIDLVEERLEADPRRRGLAMQPM